MEQKARVRKILDNNTAQVVVIRESACSGDCHKCSGCGAQKETMIVTADNPIRAEVGDFVTLTSDTASVMKAVVAVYLVPLVMFFAGFALGMTLGWGGPLVGGLGFLLGLAFAVWFDRRTAKKGETVYTITGYAPGQGHG